MSFFETLDRLKNFLADRPEWAFLAISLTVNVALFRLLMRAHQEQLATMERVLPVVDQLTTLVRTAATKARNRALPKPPEGEA